MIEPNLRPLPASGGGRPYMGIWREQMSSLYKKVSKECGMRESEVSAVLHKLNKVILSDVGDKGHCRVPGLGTFTRKERKPHAIQNVQTGKRGVTKPTSSLGFKSADSVKRELNREGPL